ncbi:MAG: ferrous iron transport protein B [Defluviitaleaceae bacterium]|nr:ferrous iron transport protein B [Defluviitaleaceae bacterium]
MSRILLMGNPNVGKSIFFTELTGIHAISSNYAGSTVSFMEGSFTVGGKEYTLIDVPGTYSLTPSSEAEAVATSFMESGAQAIICVLDASNLERNLCLGLELQQYNIPLVYALNLLDVADRHGITINTKLLEQELDAPVVPTVAAKRQGLDELITKLEMVLNTPKTDCIHPTEAKPETNQEIEHISCGNCSLCRFNSQKEPVDAWVKAKEIVRRVSNKNDIRLSFMDRLGEAMMKPMPGIPIAFLVMAIAIGVVIGGGRGLRALFFLPLVNGVIVPFFRNLFTALLPEGMFLNILVGEFGIFVISFEWILALIFPYVLLFYIVFTFLEDTGFLPRISVLFDNIMRKLGVQGGSLIHMLMGYGCAVPAIIGSRAATSRKERIVISAAICFAVPCISQSGALIVLLAGYAWWMLPAMILFSLLLFVAVTLIAGKLVKGTIDPLVIEIPNLLIPNPKSFVRKLITRMKHFLKDAEVPMMIAIIIAALLSESGLLNIIAVYAQPLVTYWLGLPAEAVIALILGIVRREMSVAPLLVLDLTALQAFVGGVVSLLYLPCLSVFAILAKEFKIKIALTITLSTIVMALFVGGLINRIGQLFIA